MASANFTTRPGVDGLAHVQVEHGDALQVVGGLRDEDVADALALRRGRVRVAARLAPSPTTTAVSSGTASAMRLASPRPTAASATSTLAPCLLASSTPCLTASSHARRRQAHGAPAGRTPTKPTLRPAATVTDERRRRRPGGRRRRCAAASAAVASFASPSAAVGPVVGAGRERGEARGRGGRARSSRP